MSQTFKFYFTDQGSNALWNAKNTGVNLDLTHIQIGSGLRLPDGTETALLEARQAVQIQSGARISKEQIRMVATFGGEETYPIGEVGVWSGDPENPGSILVMYWSREAGVLAHKYPGVDFVFNHDLVIASVLPGECINIVVAEAGDIHIQALIDNGIAAHEAKADPHPQYLKGSALTDALAAHKAEADPHAQYITETKFQEALKEISFEESRAMRLFFAPA